MSEKELSDCIDQYFKPYITKQYKQLTTEDLQHLLSMAETSGTRLMRDVLKINDATTGLPPFNEEDLFSILKRELDTDEYNIICSKYVRRQKDAEIKKVFNLSGSQYRSVLWKAAFIIQRAENMNRIFNEHLYERHNKLQQAKAELDEQIVQTKKQIQKNQKLMEELKMILQLDHENKTPEEIAAFLSSEVAESAEIWELDLPAEIALIRIEDMGLNVRAYNAIRRSGAKTAGDIYVMDYQAIKRIRNVGETVLADIMNAMQKIGAYNPKWDEQKEKQK